MPPSAEIAAATRRRPWAAGGLLARFRYMVAAADQVAISLLNFALTFVLLRLLSATEFGIVALWMAAANLALGVHTALVGAPLGIHLPAEADTARRQRLGEAVASANLLVVVLAVVAVVVVDAVSDAEWAPRGILTVMAIPVFIGAGLYREYYRGVAFGRHDMTLLLIVDAPYLAVTTACLVLMVVWPQRLAGLAGAFVALASGTAVAQLCGAWHQRRQRLRVLRHGWSATYRGISGELSWALTGAVLGHVQKRSYVYITTSLVGLAQLASLNAIAVLFRPGQILLTAWRRSALPEFAGLFAAGRVEAMDRRLLAAASIALLGCTAWCLVLWAGWRLIALHLFAGKYSGAFFLLLPWAIAICLDSVDFVLSTALQAAREFRYLAGVTMVTAPVAAAATVGLTLWHGYSWTIYGLAIGSALSVTLVVARLLTVRARIIAQRATPAAGAATSG